MSDEDNKPHDDAPDHAPAAPPEPPVHADADHAEAAPQPEAAPDSHVESAAPQEHASEVHDAPVESHETPVEASVSEAEAVLHAEEESSAVEQADHGPASEDHPAVHEPEPAAADAHELEPAPVPAESHDAEPAAVADTGPEPVAEAVSHDEPAPTPEPEPTIDPAVVAGAAALGGVAVGAAAASQADRPVWSDQGDAPFDEGMAYEPTRQRRGKRERAQKQEGGFFAELFDIIKTVVVALLIAMVVRIFFFQPFTIPSASMEPNLYEGDYIVVTKWSYGYSRHSVPWSPAFLGEDRLMGRQAERGDIVVFKRLNDNGVGYTDYIKRIIGLPGDRVQMIANVLHINGQPVVDEVARDAEVPPYGVAGAVQLNETLPGSHTFRIQDFGPGAPADDTEAFIVPEGHYFVMGDNRDNSMDSRFAWEIGGVGLVPESQLVGKAQVILFSWSPGASLFNPVTWFANVRLERFFTDLE